MVSEWAKPYPNPGVIAWLEQADEDRTFLSVITIAELRYGIDHMAASNRRKRLEEWVEQQLPLRFEQRVIGIDYSVANQCGKILARSEAAGRPMEAVDAFIAATAEIHELTLVTRNTSDFAAILKHMVNPWS